MSVRPSHAGIIVKTAQPIVKLSSLPGSTRDQPLKLTAVSPALIDFSSQIGSKKTTPGW